MTNDRTNLNVVVKKMVPLVGHLLGAEYELETRLDVNDVWVPADRQTLEQLIQEAAVCARDPSPSPGHVVIETANVIESRGETSPSLRSSPLRTPSLTVTASWESVRKPRSDGSSRSATDAEAVDVGSLRSVARHCGGHVTSARRDGEVRIGVRWAAAEPAPDASLRADGSDTLGVPETILLADDEEPVREFTRIVLERSGYRVLMAQNGADAVRVSKTYSGPIHLMLADVVMPELGGPEAFDQLHRIRPDMRVLFLSGYSARVVAREQDLVLGRAYLQKPFTMDALSRKVREVLDQ